MATILRAGVDDEGRRLDRLLRRVFPALPLSMIHRLLRQGQVSLDGEPGQAASRVRAGQLIRVAGELREGEEAAGFLPGAAPEGASPGDSPGALGGMILREGEGLLFINKRAGLAVHGPGSLETLVRAYLAPKLPPSLAFRPGPLHRLDRPTSGVVTFGAALEGARRFSALIRERRVLKRYLALVDGRVPGPLTWEDGLYRDRERRKTLASAEGGGEGKRALTRVFPLGARGEYSLVLLEIDTGRTHQIRAQAALHGHPLAGDRKYGGSFLEGGLLLHALSLEFPGREGPDRISAPLPGPFSLKAGELFGREFLKRSMVYLGYVP